MSPTVRKAMGNGALALVLAGATVGGVTAWKRYGGMNPYQALDKKRSPNPAAAIEATGVKIRHYANGKRVASADAERLTIGEDRSRILLKGVRNGVTESPQGPMQFAAGEGVLHPNMKTIDVSGGVRVKGNGGTDFDIQSERASINGRIGEIHVPTPLKGTIMGGQFKAGSMVRRMNANYTNLKKVAWIGHLPPASGFPQEVQNRVWDLSGSDATQNGVNFTYKDARASDGEVIVSAPTIVQNTKTNVITATSKDKERATYRSAKADIIADKVVIYRDEHKAVCTGNVQVYVRPKKDWDRPLPKDDDEKGPVIPDIPRELLAKSVSSAAMSQGDKDKLDELRSGKNLRDVPMSLAAEEITYWYKEGERHAIAKGGNPTALQRFDDGRWRQVWAPEAHYDGEKDMLDLLGDKAKRTVRLKNSIGDDMEAFAATLSTKEEETEETQTGHYVGLQGHAIDFSDDIPSSGGPTKSASPKGAPAGTSPPKPPTR